MTGRNASIPSSGRSWLPGLCRRPGSPRRRGCRHCPRGRRPPSRALYLPGRRGAWSSEARLVGTDRERASLKDCLIHWHNRFCGHGPSPWGTLIGVRPTKLVHHLFDQGFTADQAEKALQTSYCVAPAVARDLVAMARLQRPYVTDRGRKVALYVGIPYCPSHCLYCSFPSRLIGRRGGGTHGFSRCRPGRPRRPGRPVPDL